MTDALTWIVCTSILCLTVLIAWGMWLGHGTTRRRLEAQMKADEMINGAALAHSQARVEEAKAIDRLTLYRKEDPVVVGFVEKYARTYLS